MAQLIGYAVSHWGQDPWARGSWSLIGRDGTPRDRSGLGEPIGGRLRLAGEATHPTRAGMTHGAYEQGLQAAGWAAGLGHSRIAVVGAGLAGLAAGRALTELGADVEIWEARDRIGGRTAPAEIAGRATTGGTPTGGGPAGAGFDLGANWLQQYDDNVLARLAERLSLRTVPTDFTDPLVLGDRQPAAPAGGGPVPAMPDLEAELRDRLAAAPAGASVAEVLDTWTGALRPWEADAVRRFADAEIVMDSGAPLSWLSARHGFEPGVGAGDRWIVGGYRLLTEHLAAGLRVRLNHPVRRIVTGPDGVTITGRAGSARADAVIVTVPVGVLAADGITFDPPLPDRHRAALARLGMGRVEKVVLRFGERFWPVHRAGYYRVHGTAAHCISEWLDATAADGVPTVVGLFAGPWLDELWTGTDEAIATRAAAVLERAAQPAPRTVRVPLDRTDQS